MTHRSKTDATKKLKCTYCNKTYYDKSTLNRHNLTCTINSASKKEEMICVCGKGFERRKCYDNHLKNCVTNVVKNMKSNTAQQVYQPSVATISGNASIGNNFGNPTMTNIQQLNVHIENFRTDLTMTDIDDDVIIDILNDTPTHDNLGIHLIATLVRHMHFDNNLNSPRNKFKNIYCIDVNNSYSGYLGVNKNVWEGFSSEVIESTLADNASQLALKYSTANDDCLKQYEVIDIWNKKYNLHDFISRLWMPQTGADRKNVELLYQHIRKVCLDNRGIVKKNYESTHNDKLEQGAYVC